MDSAEDAPESSSGGLEELAAVRAERDALRAELEAKLKGKRGGHGRRTVVAIMVLFSCVAFTIAVPAVWTRRTLSSTERYVDTVAPIIERAPVNSALSQTISDEIVTLVDPETLAANALPPRAQVLTDPVASAVEEFIEDRVNEVIASDRFAQLWVTANRFIHTQIQAVLQGENEASLSTQNGQIVLNLIPAINEVLARIEARGGELLGRDVTLPDLSNAEVPDAARQKLEAALDVTIPPDLGQIVIYRADKLEAVREAAQTAHELVFLVVGLALLLSATALWISKARRRTLLQLSFGMLAGLVIVRRSALYAQDQIVDLTKAENRDAAQAIVDDVMRGLFSLTRGLMIVLLLVMVAGLVTAPYGWAVSLRKRCSDFFSALSRSPQGRAQANETVAWVRSHREALQFGGAIVGVILLLLVDVSLTVFFVVVAAIVLYEVALSRIAGAPA